MSEATHLSALHSLTPIFEFLETSTCPGSCIRSTACLRGWRWGCSRPEASSPPATSASPDVSSPIRRGSAARAASRSASRDSSGCPTPSASAEGRGETDDAQWATATRRGETSRARRTERLGSWGDRKHRSHRMGQWGRTDSDRNGRDHEPCREHERFGSSPEPFPRGEKGKKVEW